MQATMKDKAVAIKAVAYVKACEAVVRVKADAPPSLSIAGHILRSLATTVTGY